MPPTPAFPLLPGAAQRSVEGRELEIEELPEGQRRVTIFLPDSDWIVNYTFTPVSGCWWLGRIDDLSL